MTREEAIELLCYGDWLNVISEHIGKQDTERIAKAMCIVGKALRPVSREQIEKVWRGCKHCGEEWGTCNPITNRFTMPPPGGIRFCPMCGAPLTDEAVDMVMERLEALKDET